MDAGMLTIALIVMWAWFWPKDFGIWLAKVKKGYDDAKIR